MTYDGTIYRGIDSEAFREDGPLDTWGEQCLRSNALNVLAGRTSVSWQLDAGGMSLDEQGDARAFASSDWTSILMVPWVISVSLRRLVLDLLYFVGAANSTNGFDIKVELRDQQFRVLGRAEEELAYTQGHVTRKWRSERLELELTTLARAERTGWLIIWGRSQDGGEAVPGVVNLTGSTATDNEGAGLGRYISVTDGQAVDPVWTGVDLDEPVALFADGAGYAIDVMRTTTYGAYGLPTASSVDLQGIGLGYTRHYLTKLLLRSVAIESVHDATELAPDKAVYRANIAVEGAVSSGHSRLSRLAYTRPRPVLVGPDPGITDLEDPDFRSRWKLVTASDASSPYVVWQGSVRLDAENPFVEVSLFYAALHSRNDATVYAGDDDDDDRPRDALSTWTFTAELDQLEAGQTWSTASSRGTANATRRIAHMPDDPLGSHPLLYKAWLTLPGGIAEEYSELATEGQLYARDLSLLRVLTLRIPVSGLDAPARTHRACRLRVFAQHVGDTYFPGRGNTSFNRNTTDFLHLLVVGGSVWQRGNV